jgi:hypothetical protein
MFEPRLRHGIMVKSRAYPGRASSNRGRIFMHDLHILCSDLCERTSENTYFLEEDTQLPQSATCRMLVRLAFLILHAHYGAEKPR